VRQLRVLPDAVLAALVVVVTEAALIGLAQRSQFAGIWELRQGLRVLPLLTWVATAPVALTGGGLWYLARRSTDRRWARGLLLAAGLAGAGSVAFFVSTGRHFQSLPLRAGFVVVVAALGGASAWFLGPALARAERRAPVGVGAAAAIVILVLSLANVLVLPRLYPAFHLGLSALTLLVAPLLSLLWLGPDAFREPRNRRLTQAYGALVMGALLAAAGLGPAMARTLERADNVRYVYGEKAPLNGLAVRLLGAVEASQEPAAGHATGSESGPQGEGVDWRGRDIVLITVDALRADHLGSYGYGRSITPNLDALARESARFTWAYAPTPHTSYSVSSLMTGKYMRPLLLQGVGADSDTFAHLLRLYGYRTAAFYPPAVFFIDTERFAGMRDRGLDFEYRRAELSDADQRADQIETYLGKVKPERRIFLWVHLFEPHEPYVKHPEHDLGDHDLDRYDSEIASADQGIGRIIRSVRAKRPEAVILFTADHGEEFGEHGGRYHGTTVYEEQVRVPLLISAPGLITPRTIEAPVQTIDLLPTALGALQIPRSARVRGRDLGPWLGPTPPASDPGFAFAETDESTLLAEGSLRLVCLRKVGACKLFDVATDPGETRDISSANFERFGALRARLKEVEAAHGRYELAGLRAEGRAWPDAIRRGLAGDADAALDVAALLDDVEVSYRRKAAEILFELRRPETAPALRLALTRDDDDTVRRWAALALTRLGEGAARTFELVDDRDLAWRRLAALALAEAGDGRGEDTLVAWWQSGEVPFERARQLIEAFGKIKAKHAVLPLLKSLGDVRLRPHLAVALATIGESYARPGLLDAFAKERYASNRGILGKALLDLGAGPEMAPPLVRFLGVPDPLPEGLSLALRGGFLQSIGGPDDKEKRRLRDGRGKTTRLFLLIPKGARREATRLVLIGRSRGESPAPIRLGIELPGRGDREEAPAELDPRQSVELALDPGEARQITLDLPPSLGARAGAPFSVALWQSDQAEVSGLAIVPLADELPPPPPEPWTPAQGEPPTDIVDDGS
jgi:arylsulfatase A-like enzyme/HEAT repeat protein